MATSNRSKWYPRVITAILLAGSTWTLSVQTVQAAALETGHTAHVGRYADHRTHGVPVPPSAQALEGADRGYVKRGPATTRGPDARRYGRALEAAEFAAVETSRATVTKGRQVAPSYVGRRTDAPFRYSARRDTIDR